MAGYPPGVPPGMPPGPPPGPPPGYDPHAYRHYLRDQARAQRDAFRAQRQQMHYQLRGLRRGSVLGPILLIGLGVLFLLFQTGRLDQRYFWGWYGHWWPLLLVGAGVVLLAEWAFDQFHLRNPEQPRYRRSIGAGVVFLLLIFGGIGVIASHGFRPAQDHWIFNGLQFDLDDLDAFLGDKHESDQALDLAFPAAGSLVVVNPRGDVTISGASDDNRLHIAIHKQVYARTDSEANSKAQQLTPTTNTDGTVLTVAMPVLDGARADLVLTVPAAAATATTVTANHGDIHINSIKAAVTAIANHGDVDLSAIAGAATVHVNNGGSSILAHSMGSGISIAGHAQDVTLSDITGPVSIKGDFFGTAHFERIHGAIAFDSHRATFHLARLDGEAEIERDSNISADQVLGPLVLTTINGNVTLDHIAGDIHVTDHNGRIDLTAANPLGAITLEDRNGSIRAVMPENSGFIVQAGTSNGDVDTDFPLATGGGENSKSINGIVGAGGPRLTITTTNGDISIHKGEVQPLAPMSLAPPKLTLTPPATPHIARPTNK